MSEEHEHSFQHSSAISSNEYYSATYDNSNMDYNSEIDQRVAEHLQAEQERTAHIF